MKWLYIRIEEISALESYPSLSKCSINGSFDHSYFSQRIFHSQFPSHPVFQAFSHFFRKFPNPAFHNLSQSQSLSAIHSSVHTAPSSGLSGTTWLCRGTPSAPLGLTLGLWVYLTMSDACSPLPTCPTPRLGCGDAHRAPIPPLRCEWGSNFLRQNRVNHLLPLPGIFQVPQSRRLSYINTFIFICPPRTAGYIDGNIILR